MTPTRDLGLELARSEGSSSSAQRLDVKLAAAGRRPASSGAPLAAHPIMPVQVARRRANSRRGSRLGRRESEGGPSISTPSWAARLARYRSSGFKPVFFAILTSILG